MTIAPSPYSIHNPNLQIVWDSTSLRALQFCPRSYQYGILQGWRGSAVDLEFGIYFASGVETYKKARLDGATRDEAQLLALRKVVEDSWLDSGERCEVCQDGPDCTVCELPMEPIGTPWGGTYESQWRCQGTQPYKNKKGNKAKCPYSHKGIWHPAPAPHTCGECGSDTETATRYLPGDKTKNRHTLVRLIVWYVEEQAEDMSSGIHPYKFPNGKPAVELSFKYPLPLKNKYGEPYILSGHLDSIMTNGVENFISDNKSTKNTIGLSYWKQFSPNTQVDIYDMSGSLLYPELNIKGVLIEAAQIMQEGARFAAQPFYRNESQRQELLDDLTFWLSLAEKFAEDGHWPMNRGNCKICTFQGICSKEPAKRDMYLKADFAQRKWNPLEER